jgi:hypothetical protein
MSLVNMAGTREVKKRRLTGGGGAYLAGVGPADRAPATNPVRCATVSLGGQARRQAGATVHLTGTDAGATVDRLSGYGR